MRLQPNKPLQIRGQLLGGTMPLICMPLVGKNHDEIMEEARSIARTSADVIELRIDAWDFVSNVPETLAMIREIRSIVFNLPLILTCRRSLEGGYQKVDNEIKFELFEKAIQEKLIDFIDIELACGTEKIRMAKKLLLGSGVYLIISTHDFEKTPSREDFYRTLEMQIKAGADVAKLAVMPQTEEDVLNVFSSTLAIRRDYPGVPLITMAMGELGVVSRIVGGLYGSDLTFATGGIASCPGQIPVSAMRESLTLLYSSALGYLA